MMIDDLSWFCSTCNKPAVGIAIHIRSIEYKKREHSFGSGNMWVDGNQLGIIKDVVATYVTLEGNVEFYPYCQDHEKFGFLNCRLTEEVKQQLEQKIHVKIDKMENTRAVNLK